MSHVKLHPLALIRDENGKPSTSRVAFWIVLLTTLGIILICPARIPQAAYSLLGGTIIALASWAAGPRIAQYIGPQIGAAAGAIGQAKQRLVRTVDDPDAQS
jgi:hypothetical protein